MKGILRVAYLDEMEKMYTYDYDVVALDVGCVNEKEYHFQVVEKRENSILVRWEFNSVIEVFRNGNAEYSFRRDVCFDEEGSEYPVIEILSFCWIADEG